MFNKIREVISVVRHTTTSVNLPHDARGANMSTCPLLLGGSTQPASVEKNVTKSGVSRFSRLTVAP